MTRKKAKAEDEHSLPDVLRLHAMNIGRQPYCRAFVSGSVGRVVSERLRSILETAAKALEDAQLSGAGRECGRAFVIFNTARTGENVFYRHGYPTSPWVTLQGAQMYATRGSARSTVRRLEAAGVEGLKYREVQVMVIR